MKDQRFVFEWWASHGEKYRLRRANPGKLEGKIKPFLILIEGRVAKVGRQQK